MNFDPKVPTPSTVDTKQQSNLAAQVAAMEERARRFRMALALIGRAWKPEPGQHARSGVTKNKSLGETRTRRKMAKESRRKNRR